MAGQTSPNPVQQVMALLQQTAILRQAGRLAETPPLLRAAARLMPDNADLEHDLGLTLIHLNQVSAALPHLDRAVLLDPNHGPAHLNRGKVLERIGRPGFVEAYRRAVTCAPTAAEPHARLASALEQMSRRGEALVLYKRAAALSPAGSVNALIYSARAALNAEDLPAAEQASRAALAIDPASASARGLLARVLNARGKFNEAAAELEAALRDKPSDVALYYNLVKTRRLTTADSALIDRMRAALNLEAPVLARIRLHHALAKALDDIGDYAGAAAALNNVSRLRGAHYPMDRAALRAHTDRTLALFTPDYLARPGHRRSGTEVPILVLGLPRSGTTLTERILSRHPKVSGAGELGYWDSAGAGLLAALATDTDADMTAPAAAFLARLCTASGNAAHVVDKNPFNYRWALLAHLAMPQARIIHCRRHPADNALSIMMAALRPQTLFGTALDELLFCHGEYRRMMDHVRAVLPPDRLYELQYERLVAEPEAEIRSLLAFCGLDFDAACLAPELDDRAVLTASVWQVRQPINQRSAGRWRNYSALVEAFQEK